MRKLESKEAERLLLKIFGNNIKRISCEVELSDFLDSHSGSICSMVFLPNGNCLIELEDCEEGAIKNEI